ncbi:MAG TPA: penicillin-binding transpeptidase domain-containing protein [Pyrinomonadaceae bacterium]
MQIAFTRFMLIVAFFILWIGGIGVRLVHLQINQHEMLRDKALNQRRDQIKSKQLRGTIYDRNERPLAMSVKVKSLYADPREIEDVAATAKEVAAALKVKPSEIEKNLNEAKENNKRFVWLARKLDENTVDKINEALEDRHLRKFDMPRRAGLYWREEQKRSYPYQTLAAHIVGFSNADDVGSAGIEQSQEANLHGAIIKGWQDRDRHGRVYDQSDDLEEREPPKDVVLTISHSIQYKVEQALTEGVKNSNAKAGMAVVLNPKTGEILALANYPTFDPNRYTDFPVDNYVNRTIHDNYSPGSIFKLVTYSGAINERLVNADGVVHLPSNTIEVAGHRFSDHHSKKSMSYKEAMAVSSNVTAIKTGMSLGKERFFGYLQKFGFGKQTGIELPAEAKGIVRPPTVWQGDSLASMSIGYEIGVSALQMATAFATIANDGVRVQPRIIKEIRQADGNVFSATEPQKTQVVTAETARGLRSMLREVVVKGTGKRAQLEGYTSAGKTGTAWKFNPKTKRVDSSKYVSSFIGMAPAENPSVVIAVVMDEPQGGARDGGQVSAPVFREIAEQILPEMNIIPDANIQIETLTAEQVPSESESLLPPPITEDIFKWKEAEPDAEEQNAPAIDRNSSVSETTKPLKEPKAEANKSASSNSNAKEIKEINKQPKKENKTTVESDKKKVNEAQEKSKQKATVTSEKPKGETKNKSSGERAKTKT